MEEYDAFIEEIKKELLFKKNIKKIIFDDFNKINNNIKENSSLEGLEIEIQKRVDAFELLKKDFINVGIGQDELEKKIKLEKEKRIAAYNNELEKIKVNIKNKIKESIDNINSPFKKQNEQVKLTEQESNISISQDSKDLTPLNNKQKKIPQRWYALLYLLELEANNLKLPINREGSFIRSEIEEIGKQRTGIGGQGFYRKILELMPYYKDPTKLDNSFGKDWKKKIIELSCNNKSIINYIEKHY